jgi:hypothetical protein
MEARIQTGALPAVGWSGLLCIGALKIVEERSSRLQRETAPHPSSNQKKDDWESDSHGVALATSDLLIKPFN